MVSEKDRAPAEAVDQPRGRDGIAVDPAPVKAPTRATSRDGQDGGRWRRTVARASLFRRSIWSATPHAPGYDMCWVDSGETGLAKAEGHL